MEALFLTILSLSLFLLKFRAIGGIDQTILGANFHRTQALAGKGYYSGLADTAAGLVLAYSLIVYGRARDSSAFILFALATLLAVFSFSLFGGRKAFIQSVLLLFILWSLYIGRVQIMSKVVLAVLAMLAIYFIGLLEFRLGLQGQSPYYSLGGFGFAAWPIKFFANLSYNDTYCYLLDRYRDGGWMIGATYLDLFYAPIPSSVFPDKPPIDEGVYVKAWAEGVAATVPSSAAKMPFGGWPTETFGTFLMNFGPWSVFVGGAILATIFWIGWLLIQMTNFGIYSVYAFYITVMNFQLSNLRIVNLLALLLFIGLIHVLRKLAERSWTAR
jgi:hypothetical protein